MAIQIQYRRGTAAEWATANTLLAVGEPGYETDTGKFKVGDGTLRWSVLPYATIQPRVLTNASSTSPFAWSSNLYDTFVFTALANALTINADSGSPVQGQRVVFRIKDNGTARALTFTTGTTNSFREMGVALPTTTTINKTIYLGFIYNATDSRWDLIAKTQEA